MHIPIRTALALALIGLAATPASQAQDGATANQVSIGFKVWNASWSSYLPAAYAGVDANGQSTLGESFDAAEGQRRTDILPLFAIRHDRLFLSGSYGRYTSDFHVRTSTVPVAAGTTLITSRTDHFDRREADLAIGYYVTPELALTLGYKDAAENRATRLGAAAQVASAADIKASVVLIGAVGSFAVQDKLRLYFQAGYGPTRLKTRFSDAALAPIDANARYLIGEVGLTYPLFGGNSWLRAANASIGYRTQTVKADSRGTIYYEPRQLRDVRDGLVVSVTATL